MILKQTILAGLAMLMLSISLKGEIFTTVDENSITVSTDKEAVAGYKGCDMAKVEEVPAYVFDLQTKARGIPTTCGVNKSGRWSSFFRQNSTDGTAMFKNLPDGKYRIVCYAGFAIGCEIKGDTKGLPNNSIVFEKEISKTIDLMLVSSNANENKFLIQDKIGDLNIFPIPAKDKISIQFKNKEMEKEVTINLIDILGQSIKSSTYSIDENVINYSWSIDVDDFPAGTYFINLIDRRGLMISRKIIIQKD